MMRLLRELRLLKLARILRASRIMVRWESYFAPSSSARSLMLYSVASVILIHWTACTFALLPLLVPSWRDAIDSNALEQRVTARMAIDPTCAGCIAAEDSTLSICSSLCLTPCAQREAAELERVSEQYIFNGMSWICRQQQEGFLPADDGQGSGHWHNYLEAVLIALMGLVGSVATMVPSNTNEYVLMFFVTLIGAVVFAAIQGVICGVFTNGDPSEIAWRQEMDALNFMMADHKLDRKTRVGVRDYFRRSKSLRRRWTHNELMERCLSEELAGYLRYCISYEVFRKIDWLVGCEPAVLVKLALRLQVKAFAAREWVDEKDKLCILTRGFAWRASVMLSLGDHWGDIIVTAIHLRDSRKAKALGYCEVTTLSRASLFEVIHSYPEAQA